MAVEIQLREHKVNKATQWGTVERSLGQHIVMIKTDNDQFVQCGYVGKFAFMPLSGFPDELSADVAAECAKQLGRPVGTVLAPLSNDQINALVAADTEDDE